MVKAVEKWDDETKGNGDATEFLDSLVLVQRHTKAKKWFLMGL